MDPNYQQGMYYSPDMMGYGGYGQFGVPDPGSAMMLAQQAMDYHALQHYNYTQLAAYHDPNMMMGMDDGSGGYGQQQHGNYPAQRKNFLQIKNVEEATAQQMQDFLLELLGSTDASIFQGFYKHEQSWFANFHDESVAHFAMTTIRTHYVGENKLFVKLFTYRQLPKQVQRQAAHGKQGGGQQHQNQNQNQHHQQHSSSHHNQSHHNQSHHQGGHHGHNQGHQQGYQGHGHGGHGGHGYDNQYSQHSSSHNAHGGHHHSGGGHQNQHNAHHGGHGHHGQHHHGGQHGGRTGPRGNHSQAAAAAAATVAAQQAAAQAAAGQAGQAIAAVVVTPDESAGIWNRTGTSGGGSPPKFRRTQPRGPTPGAPPGANPLSPLSGSTTTDTEGMTEQSTPLSTSEAAWEATEKGKYKDAAKYSALLPVVQVPGPTTEIKAFAVGRGKPIVAAAEGRITPPGVSVVPLAR